MLEDFLIVIAHPDELNDDLRSLPNMLITGVGKVNAAYHLTKRLTGTERPKYVLNMGSAGSKKFPKGCLVMCNKFIQRDMDCTAFGYDMCMTPGDGTSVLEHDAFLTGLPAGICGTGDSFVTTSSVPDKIDVVDMEAYALARVCKTEGIPFAAVKYITDGLDETGGDDWKTEVKSAPESLYEYLEKLS